MSRLDEYQKRLACGEEPYKIMNDMEKEFKIPMIKDEKYNKENSDVIEFYKEVANSRDL